MEACSKCYYCGSVNIVKNGRTYYGKSRGKYKQCGKQFVFKRAYPGLNPEQNRRIELLLLERVSLQGICRVMEIKPGQLYRYMEELYQQVPADLNANIASGATIDIQRFDCEADELWSFVGWKANKQWVWLAQDRSSRQIIAVYISKRSVEGAKGLWQQIPDSYRQRATFYTDDWNAYKQVIPRQQHRYSDRKKDTNHMERFFATLRQRAARLVRLSLAFSKKLTRHIQAIRFFIAYYNLSLQS